jgi:hypothetical protein
VTADSALPNAIRAHEAGAGFSTPSALVATRQVIDTDPFLGDVFMGRYDLLLAPPLGVW